jgi:uncharacterized protein
MKIMQLYRSVYAPVSALIMACTLALVLSACGRQASVYDASAVLKERQEKDEFFGKHYQSPLEEEQKNNFKGLHYYAPNALYSAQARVERFERPDTANIKANDASNLKMIKWGTLHFSLQGVSYALTALKPMKDDEDIRALALHIYFADATNDDATYEAGRYVYVMYKKEPQNGDTVVIDFNRSFNPFCAYNSAFVCPLIPPENRMNTRIEAGEQRFKH